MRQLKYTIRTLSPVVMSALSNSTVMTTTHNEFRCAECWRRGMSTIGNSIERHMPMRSFFDCFTAG